MEPRGNPALVTLVNTYSGELQDVPGDDSERSRALRESLYRNGWARPERRRCRLDVHLLACDCVQTVQGRRVVGKRHGPDSTYFLRRCLDEIHAADAIAGKTLTQVNAEVARAYIGEAIRSGACSGKPNCVHDKAPVHMDTGDYLRRLDYVEVYQNVPERGWLSLLTLLAGGDHFSQGDH